MFLAQLLQACMGLCVKSCHSLSMENNKMPQSPTNLRPNWPIIQHYLKDQQENNLTDRFSIALFSASKQTQCTLVMLHWMND